MTRQRRAISWLLVAAFVVVPLVEIYVLIQVGQVIGPWPTIALLILDSVLGSWLIKREGSRAWRELSAALNTGAIPGRELADAALILIGGTLMLTPGFVTDVLGLLLISPFSRPVARRLLISGLRHRFLRGNLRRPAPGTGESVVRGEAWEE
jgi:UPF0716 protein FxsA